MSIFGLMLILGISTPLTVVLCWGLWMLDVIATSTIPQHETKEEPRHREMTRKQLNAAIENILESEKELRAMRWRYITAGSNARYL